MAKRNVLRLTTPAGRAKWPWLNTPDVRFNPDGEYRVSLLFTPAEAEEITAQLDNLADEAVTKAKKDLQEKGKAAAAKQVVRMAPYVMETDQEGEETGMVELRFKMKRVVKTKDGKLLEFSPRLFDAKGKAINPDEVKIFGGSVIKVNFTPNPYYVASSKGAGISLQLNAVQILELASGGNNASFFGFSEEDGYEAAPAPATETEGENITTNDEETEATDF